MELLIKSPKITRGKGIRSVRDEDVEKGRINETDAAYTKLFDYYLSDQQSNKIPVRKLINHDYFAHLLRNRKELQHMKMHLLSKVLLFLDSKDDNIFSANAKLEILDSLNDFSIKQTKKTSTSNTDDTKENKEHRQNKEILDFFRYTRFVKELMDGQKLKTEDEDEEGVRLWIKQEKLPTIHPHTDTT